MTTLYTVGPLVDIKKPYPHGTAYPSGRTVQVRRVDGIRSLYASEGGPDWAYIDASIAHIVARLAELGCRPWTSCSGLKADHYTDDRWWGAYVALSTPTPAVHDALRLAGFYNRNPDDRGAWYAWDCDASDNIVGHEQVKGQEEYCLVGKWMMLASLIGAKFSP